MTGAQPALPLGPPPARIAPERGAETDASAISRGVCRTLAGLGYRTLTEMRLASGRRVDVMGLDGRGRFAIAEIKTSLADLHSDRKWPEYLPYCDAFFFAVPGGFPLAVLPPEMGLIVADRYGGEVVRAGGTVAMRPAERRRQTLSFALKASGRLFRIQDIGL